MKIKITKGELLKYFCVAGIVILGWRTSESIYNLMKRNEHLVERLSLKKYCGIENVIFYVPDNPKDYIQRHMAFGHDFFEREDLNASLKWIPENAVILDIGANIGNHSVFWASKCHPKKIYAFEPVHYSFKILEKNVRLNKFENVIELMNIGLSDEKTNAKITHFHPYNIGGTHIAKSADGDLSVDKLDNIDIEENRVDFIKIDVEGHEQLVLKGAKETLAKYKPLIWIELLKENFREGDKLLKELGYESLGQVCPGSDNYLYIHKSKQLNR